MKRFYKKVFVFLILFGLFGIVSNGLALQLVWPDSPGGTQLEDGIEISQMVKYFYEWGISLGGIAAFFSLITAGFKYLTSVGNESKMREARDKINSSFFGLLLLLSSFLVLNVINPELTTLRMPDDIGSAPGNLAPIEIEQPDTSIPCEKVIAYSQVKFQGNASEISPGSTSGDLSLSPGSGGIGGRALSIEVRGFCIAELYSSVYCSGDPVAAISTDLVNVNSVFLDEPGVVCINNSAGATSSPCDADCSQCSHADCMASPANCVWQEFFYQCVKSECSTNCSECDNDTSCAMSEAGCMWNYAPPQKCEPTEDLGW